MFDAVFGCRRDMRHRLRRRCPLSSVQAVVGSGGQREEEEKNRQLLSLFPFYSLIMIDCAESAEVRSV